MVAASAQHNRVRAQLAQKVSLCVVRSLSENGADAPHAEMLLVFVLTDELVVRPVLVEEINPLGLRRPLGFVGKPQLYLFPGLVTKGKDHEGVRSPSQALCPRRRKARPLQRSAAALGGAHFFLVHPEVVRQFVPERFVDHPRDVAVGRRGAFDGALKEGHFVGIASV